MKSANWIYFLFVRTNINQVDSSIIDQQHLAANELLF